MEEQCNEFAEDVTYQPLARANHWVPEEQPEAFVELLKGWFEKKGLLT
jgi:hypothetical protein